MENVEPGVDLNVVETREKIVHCREWNPGHPARSRLYTDSREVEGRLVRISLKNWNRSSAVSGPLESRVNGSAPVVIVSHRHCSVGAARLRLAFMQCQEGSRSMRY
jgi:hypothetical protein